MRAEIKWKQRFQSYYRVLEQLTRFLDRTELNELEEQGLIKSFEYNRELAWKTLKDFLEFQGETKILDARDVVRRGFRLGLLGESEEEGRVWMDLIGSRNMASHAYDEETAKAIIDAINDHYFDAFCALCDRLADHLGDG